MTKILCLLAGLFSLACGPALAADNYVITSGGAQRTVRAKDVGGVLVQMSMPTDATGTPYSGSNGLPVAQQGTWTFGLSGPGPLALAAKQPALGTAGSASADVLTVQGIANGTPLPVSGTFTANANLTGTYNSTPPTLSNGASSALQLDASGNLRVSGSFAATTSGVVATSSPSYGNGTTQSLSLTTAGALRVDGSGAPQPVTASALPLPAGAATAANQSTLNTSAAAIAASVASLDTKTPASGSPQPVDTVVRATSADRGGSITSGGTAQQFMASNASRRGFVVQNQSTGDLYVNCLATAVVGSSSLRIPPSVLYETPVHHVGAGACSIIGATTGQAFYAREF